MPKINQICNLIASLEMKPHDAELLRKMMCDFRTRHSVAYRDLMKIPGTARVWTTTETLAALSCAKRLGSMQRYLFELLYESDKPMTLAAIRRAAAGEDFVFRFTVERSLRHALKRMVDNEVVVANGDRFCIHPRILAIMADGKA